jgi:hypothetical protein
MNVAVENRFQAGRKPKTRASPKTASSGTLSKKRHSFNELIQSEIIQWAVIFSYGCSAFPSRF